MTPFRNLAAAGGLLGLLIGTSAIAAPVIFFGENQSAGGSSVSGQPVSARTSFLGNLADTVQSEGFESFKLGNTAPLNLNFQGSSGTLSAALTGSGQIYDTPGAGRFNTTAGGKNLWEVTDNNFTLDFGSTLISAFGFYGTDIGDFGGRITIALTDQNDVVTNYTVGSTINGNDGALLFWGFTDAGNKYKRIVFGNTASGVDEFGFDDMVIGDLRQVVPTPVHLPATLSLVGLALAGLAFTRRRAS